VSGHTLGDRLGVVPPVAVVALALGADPEGEAVGGRLRGVVRHRVERGHGVLCDDDVGDLRVEDGDADRRGDDGAVESVRQRVQRRLLPARADDAGQAGLRREGFGEGHASALDRSPRSRS
jgi:hypothetical protein